MHFLLEKFSSVFSINVGFQIVMQAVFDKKTVQVELPSQHHLSLFITPLLSPSSKPCGAMVFGLQSSGNMEKDKETCTYLQEAGSLVAKYLSNHSMNNPQETLVKRLEALQAENEQLKIRDVFNRSFMMEMLAGMEDCSIMCTTTQGIFTYVGPGSQKIFGYKPEDLIGKYTPLKLHDQAEVEARSKKMEMELGSPVRGFDVFTEYPKRGIIEHTKWRVLRKDGTYIRVILQVRPLIGVDSYIVGYMGIAKVVPDNDSRIQTIL